ncbi:hypothetical protein KB976_004008 [Vibrio parahaemolyticus]|nr:hypothetical protein [Vibrio parahaemolyticus]
MLAFLKKWRKAYLEDKGDRLHAQVEAERNVLCQTNTLSFDDAKHALNAESTKKQLMNAWAQAADEIYQEGCRRGYH